METDNTHITNLAEEAAINGGAATVGWADLTGLTPLPLQQYHRALSLIFVMDPQVMATLVEGPNDKYAALYDTVNRQINQVSEAVASHIRRAGYQAWPVPASVRSDPDNIRGDFPHKTAATRAGLGWVGKHAQLVTWRWGPWIRLGTVLTDLAAEPDRNGPPVNRDYCGDCRACVDACPAGALHGATWTPGLQRDLIFDPAACDEYKKKYFYQFHQGHNCGICTAACPFGQKYLRRSGRET